MVATRDLPEAMPEAEFKRRFGGVDAPAYNRIAEIDGRIAALPAIARPWFSAPAMYSPARSP